MLGLPYSAVLLPSLSRFCFMLLKYPVWPLSSFLQVIAMCLSAHPQTCPSIHPVIRVVNTSQFLFRAGQCHSTWSSDPVFSCRGRGLLSLLALLNWEYNSGLSEVPLIPDVHKMDPGTPRQLNAPSPSILLDIITSSWASAGADKCLHCFAPNLELHIFALTLYMLYLAHLGNAQLLTMCSTSISSGSVNWEHG